MMNSNVTSYRKNRVNENDTITAHSYDKNGKIIASLYDSGFNSIQGIIDTISDKGSGELRKIREVFITNETKGWIGRYTSNGNLIK